MGVLRFFVVGLVEWVVIVFDVLIMKEVGFFDFIVENWYGMVVFKGILGDIVMVLYGFVIKVMVDFVVKEKFVV